MPLWTVKYAPQVVDDIAGNDESKSLAKKWALEWSRGKKQKPLLVYGPSGSGKTALAHALASEFGWTLVESSSSDVRNEKALDRKFGSASTSGLFGMRLLVIDDLDSVFDRGEVPALLELLSSAEQPMVLCANDVWDPKLSKIRAECIKVELKKINKTTVKSVLKKIAEAEKIPFETAEFQKYVEEIAESCGGDLRGAIIDFQSGFVSERERGQDVFKNVAAVLKGSFNSALQVEPDDFDLFLRWIEENIPNEYEKPDDVARAFDAFSRSDVFKGRIMRRQNYGLLKFVRAMAFGGVAAAKKEPYRKFSSYQFPSIIRMLGASKGERALIKSISAKAGEKMHSSDKDAFQSLVLLDSPGSLAGYFGLTEDEEKFLKDLLKERSGK